MVIGDSRFQRFGIWPAEAAGMGELKADDEVIRAAEAFAVRADEDFPNLGQAGLVLIGKDELIWVCAAIWTQRNINTSFWVSFFSGFFPRPTMCRSNKWLSF